MTVTAAVTVVSPGLHTLIVDQGRPSSRNLGVSVGGAADRFSLAIGNALVGNDPSEAALEITLSGPTLTTNAPISCVLWGAPFDLFVDNRSQSSGITFTLEPGQLLRIGGTAWGARAYLCIHGGIDAPQILGSRSGFSSLKSGTILPCRTSRMPGRSVKQEWLKVSPRVLRVLPGGQSTWFPPGVLSRQASFEVTPASNRMGVRLRGEALPVPSREMVSEPVCPGTVQVTRDGQCIVLGVDGQTIGGYPRIAQVIRADLDCLAQLRPGESIRFEEVTLQEAEQLSDQRERMLREWLTRLEVVHLNDAVTAAKGVMCP